MRHLLRSCSFELHFDVLIGPDSLLRDEVTNGLDQADLVVKTARANNRRSDALGSVTDGVGEACLLGVTSLRFIVEADGIDETLRRVL